MNHHSGGLVDDGEVVVFVDDVERDIFGDGAQRGTRAPEPRTLMCSPPRSFREALAGASLTRTFWSAMSSCTRARLTSRCGARNWSRRWPAASAVTAKIAGLAVAAFIGRTDGEDDRPQLFFDGTGVRYLFYWSCADLICPHSGKILSAKELRVKYYRIRTYRAGFQVGRFPSF